MFWHVIYPGENVCCVICKSISTPGTLKIPASRMRSSRCASGIFFNLLGVDILELRVAPQRSVFSFDWHVLNLNEKRRWCKKEFWKDLYALVTWRGVLREQGQKSRGNYMKWSSMGNNQRGNCFHKSLCILLYGRDQKAISSFEILCFIYDI